jgi:putative chitinase
MLISEAVFNKVFPKAIKGMYQAIDKHIDLAGCFNKQQQAMFLAQCGHETRGFTALSENLNYSADGLMKVFRKYFPNPNIASKYEHQAEKIASRVYANRYGNGSEETMDGWNYRGRGLIHLTFKDNYIRFAQWLGDTINPKEVSSNLDLAVKAAVWYWIFNDLAMIDSVQKVTIRINGGTNGIDDRCRLFRELMTA